MTDKTFSLKAAPTFATKVSIPIAGTDGAELECTFRHKRRTDLKEFLESIETRPAADALFEILAGWTHPTEAFSREALEELLDNHHAAGHAILQAYLHQLTGGLISARSLGA